MPENKSELSEIKAQVQVKVHVDECDTPIKSDVDISTSIAMKDEYATIVSSPDSDHKSVVHSTNEEGTSSIIYTVLSVYTIL